MFYHLEMNSLPLLFLNVLLIRIEQVSEHFYIKCGCYHTLWIITNEW